MSDNRSLTLSERLFLNIAEQVKLPLYQIAREAEISRMTGNIDLPSIENTAHDALRLLDNYVLSVGLEIDYQELLIEPVSIASVLYDTGQQLDSMAKRYGIELELNIAGRYGLVMAHRHGLESALVSLGSALIEALPALGDSQLKLQLATHRCRYGIVAGVYTNTGQLTNEVIRQGRRLYGRARQPLASLTHTAGAGFFVADALMKAMHLQLRTSRHQRLYGLGAVLQPSRQMQLV